MQNNLDKFFNEKFQEREFEFNEAHWQGAAAMIETGEKMKFWKNFAWAAVSVALFFAGGIGSYYYSQSDSAETVIAQDNSQTITSPTLTNEKGDNNQLATLDVPSSSSSPEAIAGSKLNTTTTVESNATLNNNLTTKQAGTITSGIQTNNTSLTQTEQTSTTTSSQPSTTLFSKANSTTSNEVTGSLAEQSISERGTDAISKIDARESEAIHKPILSLIAQSIDNQALTPLDLTTGELSIQENSITHPVIDGTPQRFFAGVTAGGSHYPSSGNFTGAQAGLTFKYKLKSQLSLNADLLYHYRPGEFSFFSRGTDISFKGFGSLKEEYLSKASHLSYFEIPVYLQYQLGKHHLEAGVGASYLAAVRGEVGKKVDLDNPNMPVAYERTSQGWIDNYGYKSLNAQLILGYQFGLTDQLTIGLRANYTVGGIHNLNEIKDMQLNEQPKLFYNLSAKWYIF